ncbi:MAG: single-stranded DNA-binding protein [Candidatus Omnitrophica bacterium]|nr:single-stranded DNA-binding protein [Candidatus Omnitrophota bacterium]
MASLNRVMLMGNLTRDPELRYIPSGAAVTTFDLAVNRVYTMQSGEKKKDTCFIRIVVWGKTAEACGEYLSKGTPVFVEGRLQSRSWVGQDGQKRNTIEVVANNVQFLKPKSQQAAEPPVPETQLAPELPPEDADQSKERDSSGEVGSAGSRNKEGEVPF